MTHSIATQGINKYDNTMIGGNFNKIGSERDYTSVSNKIRGKGKLIEMLEKRRFVDVIRKNTKQHSCQH